MDNWVKINDNLRINISTIYSTQRIVEKIENVEYKAFIEHANSEIEEIYNDFVDKCVSGEMNVLDEDGFVILPSDENYYYSIRKLAEKQYIDNNSNVKIPPQYINKYKYILTLNTGVTVNADKNTYDIILKAIDKNLIGQ